MKKSPPPNVMRSVIFYFKSLLQVFWYILIVCIYFGIFQYIHITNTICSILQFVLLHL